MFGKVESAGITLFFQSQQTSIKRRILAGWATMRESRYKWACGCLLIRHVRSTAPPVNSDEQEQPNDIDEVPVPCGKFEAEVVFRSKLAFMGTI